MWIGILTYFSPNVDSNDTCLAFAAIANTKIKENKKNVRNVFFIVLPSFSLCYKMLSQLNNIWKAGQQAVCKFIFTNKVVSSLYLTLFMPKVYVSSFLVTICASDTIL